MIRLCLYIIGDRQLSIRAQLRLPQLVARLDGEVETQVVDILLEPTVADAANVFATPLLVRESPLPERRVVGDLQNIEAVLHHLGLPLASSQQGDDRS